MPQAHVPPVLHQPKRGITGSNESSSTTVIFFYTIPRSTKTLNNNYLYFFPARRPDSY
uniref:Uncharacterized protein n=1 Tax=Arion vulgaris TaxID=1028688 RepID=A0A0B7B799_9EUPU